MKRVQGYIQGHIFTEALGLRLDSSLVVFLIINASKVEERKNEKRRRKGRFKGKKKNRTGKDINILKTIRD